jgi:hypothetical protein
MNAGSQLAAEIEAQLRVAQVSLAIATDHADAKLRRRIVDQQRGDNVVLFPPRFC